jgi:hypothetical protein
VNAKDREVIFGRQHANIDISQGDQLRTRVEDINVFPIKGGESLVKIQRELMIRPVIQGSFSAMVLRRVNTQVDISAGPQTCFRVETSRRPSLDQYGFYVN